MQACKHFAGVAIGVVDVPHRMLQQRQRVLDELDDRGGILSSDFVDRRDDVVDLREVAACFAVVNELTGPDRSYDRFAIRLHLHPTAGRLRSVEQQTLTQPLICHSLRHHKLDQHLGWQRREMGAHILHGDRANGGGTLCANRRAVRRTLRRCNRARLGLDPLQADGHAVLAACTVCANRTGTGAGELRADHPEVGTIPLRAGHPRRDVSAIFGNVADTSVARVPLAAFKGTITGQRTESLTSQRGRE